MGPRSALENALIIAIVSPSLYAPSRTSGIYVKAHGGIGVTPTRPNPLEEGVTFSHLVRRVLDVLDAYRTSNAIIRAALEGQDPAAPTPIWMDGAPMELGILVKAMSTLGLLDPREVETLQELIGCFEGRWLEPDGYLVPFNLVRTDRCPNVELERAYAKEFHVWERLQQDTEPEVPVFADATAAAAACVA